MIKEIKKALAAVPSCVGVYIAFIPFRYRLGKNYTFYKNSASVFKDESFVFHKMKSLVCFCEREIPFYRYFYAKKGFSSASLNSFDDLKKIPILTKSDLQESSFEDRVFNSGKSGIITNTGGTSGQPLKLMIDSNAYAREWGHMHTIWERLGYRTNCVKLTIRGMNLGEKPLVYNFVHNEFQVNAYCDFDLVLKSLDKVLDKYKIEYFHGYPSGIYEFVKQLSESDAGLLGRLKKNLKGVFFGSEYPAVIYRDYIESELSVSTISWYGHTEMAVLAAEKGEPFLYYPFQSYGFTESIEIDGKYHLVGTTIDNYFGPLVRYDTGDLIEPVSYRNGLLESFKIKEGRVGEFVTDLNGRRISLTALIFGRHHEIFEYANFIQVKQIEAGRLTVYVTTSKEDLDFSKLFDSSGINMFIDFVVIKKPYKTKSGKVSLLIRD